MARSVVSGFLLGSAFSGLVLAGASLTAPLPGAEAPQADAAVPPAETAPPEAAPPETLAPVPPEAVAAPRIAPETPIPVPPPGEVVVPRLAPGGAPAPELAAPDVDMPGGDVSAEMPTETPDAMAAGTPVEAAPEIAPPETVVSETVPEPAPADPAPSEPAPSESADAAPAAADAETPETLAEADAPLSAPEAEPAPEPETPAAAPAAPEAGPAPMASERPARLRGSASVGFENAEGVRVNRLARIEPEAGAGNGSGANTEAGATPQVRAADDLPPRLRFAAPFSALDDAAQMTVVLVDVGGRVGGIDRASLKSMGFPVTVALDPMRPDAAQVAADYRAAGFEVAILAAPLPQGAQPEDLEQVLQGWRSILPEAVAVIEPPAPVIQNAQVLAAQLVEALTRDGLGLVTQDRGLNAAQRLARREGLAQAQVWRVIDADRPRAEAVKRMLDRAAFEARRDGAVVVMLQSWPESVEGLMAWAATPEEGLQLAPLSAVLDE
ncbi:divergent polysaccharide deacetylase family protein [Phaeovulum vinaykumarii]|uniref:Divergent polysaccharide deacetylase n=1 Tax=Phaeovulum vinaykumarii TaxID=407234 RepID=A0A1N7M1T9_9RHOB|nr:divergent polysaccharide deacetylase family protein [Phaeovulum vinaykumarii]SIS80055.1 hypothetical protein SAMN05421795_10572 [Phaeovulum vinaykumarii]SOC09429.1 hypothetical protein SAMN05878426_105130 [Phaeovulum vinaykumarii]